MSYPKVLIGIVTYDGKDYVWDKFYKNINNLTYPELDIMCVDNSKSKKAFKQRKKDCPSWINVHHKRAENSRITQAECLNVIRDYFLDNDYDYLMLIESDLIPPVDIVERLMRHNKSCVGTIYYIGHQGSESQPPRPCLFVADGPQTRNLPPEEGWAYYGTGLREIHGCGFGSTLMHKRLVKKYRFWYHLGAPVKHSDVLWYMDMHNDKETAYVDTDVVVPHYNSNWNHVKDI